MIDGPYRKVDGITIRTASVFLLVCVGDLTLEAMVRYRH